MLKFSLLFIQVEGEGSSNFTQHFKVPIHSAISFDDSSQENSSSSISEENTLDVTHICQDNSLSSEMDLTRVADITGIKAPYT